MISSFSGSEYSLRSLPSFLVAKSYKVGFSSANLRSEVSRWTPLFGVLNRCFADGYLQRVKIRSRNRRQVFSNFRCTAGYWTRFWFMYLSILGLGDISPVDLYGSSITTFDSRQSLRPHNILKGFKEKCLWGVIGMYVIPLFSSLKCYDNNTDISSSNLKFIPAFDRRWWSKCIRTTADRAPAEYGKTIFSYTHPPSCPEILAMVKIP